MQQCPCSSDKSYDKCCEPYLTGKQTPSTPAAMMRSRYTAFVLNDMDYIAKTIKGRAAEVFNKEASKEWTAQVQWQGLKIVNSYQPNATVGFVEFVAHYRENGQDQYLHEESEFHLEDSNWYYVDGKVGAVNRTPVKTTKVGRNDPCPCGSGKKYKKCCGK